MLLFFVHYPALAHLKIYFPAQTICILGVFIMAVVGYQNLRLYSLGFLTQMLESTHPTHMLLGRVPIGRPGFNCELGVAPDCYFCFFFFFGNAAEEIHTNKAQTIIFYWGGGGVPFLGLADNFFQRVMRFKQFFSLHFVMKTIFLRPFFKNITGFFIDFI